MTRRIAGLLGMLVLLTLPVAGCAEPGSVASPYASLEDDGSAESSVSRYIGSHNDQGLMADMSFSDVDFVPHSASLSSTGEARLKRFTELLADGGGRLNYDASITDKKLISSRMETARCFLSEAMPSDQTIRVAQGLPGGRGMSGKDALAAREVGAQPEPRKTAYQLSDKKGNRESGN